MEESQMEQRIKQLLKRLSFLGYCSFEIRNIIQDVAGSSLIDEMSYAERKKVIRHLEQYEQLGLNFVQAYSK
jgi:hypothetical protein